MSDVKGTLADKAFDIINMVFVSLILVLILYPLVYVLSASISDPDLVNTGKVWLLPRGITFEGYARVFENNEIMIGYRNTIFYTIGGTLINLVLTLPAAYALSKKYLPGHNLIMFFFVVTMYFSGGMIPTYLVVKNLGLMNTWWVLLVTAGVSTFNLIIARTFFANGVPHEIEEAAMCDGCSEIRTFLTIVLPLSKALLGVLALHYGIEHWNGFFRGLLYLTDRGKIPLQLILREILIQQQMTASMMENGGDEDAMITALRAAALLRYAVIVVASVPIIAVYPFLQKYFNKGVMLGSVKG